jgi:hypothetical protein
MIALGSVVVNYVHDHLDSSGMEIPHHRFELGYLPAVGAAA